MMNGTIVKLLAVLIAWAVCVQVFVPDTNVKGYADIANNVNSDPFQGMPAAPTFPDYDDSGSTPDNCTGLDLGCYIGYIGDVLYSAIMWIVNIFVYVGLGVMFLLIGLVEGIVWVGGMFIGLIALIFGAATFQLEDDDGNDIVIDPNVQLLLYGISAFIWLLVAIWIISVIRGNG